MNTAIVYSISCSFNPVQLSFFVRNTKVVCKSIQWKWMRTVAVKLQNGSTKVVHLMSALYNWFIWFNNYTQSSEAIQYLFMRNILWMSLSLQNMNDWFLYELDWRLTDSVSDAAPSLTLKNNFSCDFALLRICIHQKTTFIVLFCSFLSLKDPIIIHCNSIERNNQYR